MSCGGKCTGCKCKGETCVPSKPSLPVEEIELFESIRDRMTFVEEVMKDVKEDIENFTKR